MYKARLTVPLLLILMSACQQMVNDLKGFVNCSIFARNSAAFGFPSIRFSSLSRFHCTFAKDREPMVQEPDPTQQDGELATA